MESKDKQQSLEYNVFNEQEMEKRLPKEVYEAIHATKNGTHFSDEYANILADAMKQWAIERGATHFTHWFQPMTNATAEKHESFDALNQEGIIITKFRAKQLLKGEPDASSFPSGGIRATFEARGYTVWDPTSYAFVKDNTLYIPTAFFSFSGEILDKKTPLLKSNQALNKQCLRILKLFNSQAKHCEAKVGAEQEYFLIDKSVFLKRKDLIYCGRTLLGANPPKDQQLDDHYFGSIKPRVHAFMRDLDSELNKLGILAKTEHNEVAPSQHELAPAYTNSNLASDQNQITMDMMKRVADRHGMACLLHEKPFRGINGSGKHINWSIFSSDDQNLFERGTNAQQNAQFMLFMSAVIKAVDNFQDVLRAVTASAGNDHRLGASEAPPSIVSVFVGHDLEAVIDGIINGTKIASLENKKMQIGVDVLPQIPCDTTDRNRTSPIAFTGNKFEFRSLGSPASIADPVTVINTAVAEALCQFADVLENSTDFNADLEKLICQTFKKHRRIIFGGDGYSQQWKDEAQKRGLLNLSDTPEALPCLLADKNIQLFVKHSIFTKRELLSRVEILYQNYALTLRIEGLTLVEMLQKEIIPCVEKYIGKLAKIAKDKKHLELKTDYEINTIQKLSKHFDAVCTLCQQLSQNLQQALTLTSSDICAKFYRDSVLALMNEIRVHTNELEKMCPAELWTLPSYGDILYSVN